MLKMKPTLHLTFPFIRLICADPNPALFPDSSTLSAKKGRAKLAECSALGLCHGSCLISLPTLQHGLCLLSLGQRPPADVHQELNNVTDENQLPFPQATTTLGAELSSPSLVLQVSDRQAWPED